jgi:hypothetical protein
MNQVDVIHCYKDFHLFRVTHLRCEGLDTLSKLLAFKKKVNKKQICITHCILHLNNQQKLIVPLQNVFICSSYLEGTMFQNSYFVFEENNIRSVISFDQLSDLLRRNKTTSKRIELQCKLKHC